MNTELTFLDMVSKNYDSIRKMLIINSLKLKVSFDEDLFHDTLLKCSRSYKDDINNINKIKNYIWVAFRKNTSKALVRKKVLENIDDLQDFDIIDEDYIVEMDELYDIIKEELIAEFGEEITDLWFRHVGLEETYDVLEAESGIKNIHYQFKKIRKYIREEILTKNIRVSEIVDVLGLM